MKDTKENKVPEREEKLNFQALRKCMLDDNCNTYNW